MNEHPLSPEDRALQALLAQHWQAPAASCGATQRLLAAAEAAPKMQRWRWALPGVAVAATLLAAVWVMVPTQKNISTAHVSDEEVMSYMFATYELEEIL
jgi:hypothetical protein